MSRVRVGFRVRLTIFALLSKYIEREAAG